MQCDFNVHSVLRQVSVVISTTDTLWKGIQNQ